jgi:hypothetical protein
MSVNDSNATDWDDVTSRFYDNRPFPKDVKPDCMLPADHREMMKDEVYDPVNQPKHYKVGEVESIDYIYQQLGSGAKDYLLGNVHKYLHRHRFKGQTIQDLKKAQWYLQKLVMEEEQGG